MLQRFGFSYDWRREISTCDPEYYEWNQWLFLRMLEKQIAFRRKSKVNWCPLCQTVLANEQVIDGFCWRHETTQVEQQRTRTVVPAHHAVFRSSCSSDMEQLEGGWPERVLVMQRNWIGKSHGARVQFAVSDAATAPLEVFTTRIDTIYGVAAVLLSALHPQLEEMLAGVPGHTAMEAQLHAMRQKSTKAADIATAEKVGFFTGRLRAKSIFRRARPHLGSEFCARGIWNRGGDVCSGA